MGDCGCNKKGEDQGKSPEEAKKEFRKQVEQSQQSKVSMVKSFATSIASRGLTNKKTTKPIKQLRVLSCLGDGKELPPCEHLKESVVQSGKMYCGGCGCGDKPGTWLLGDGEEYSKLDYPRLNCPLQMPGFTNYEASDPDEANEPVTRRYYIEQIPYEKMEEVPVSMPEMPEELRKLLEKEKTED
jgi:hypothetical protein